jgi:hypothetical protein
MMLFGNATRESTNINLNTTMFKMLEKLVRKLLPVALASAGFLGTATAETRMTVSGPDVTSGYNIIIDDLIPERPGLEMEWAYKIRNTSTVGDINNMIEWHIDAGSNNNILDAYVSYNGNIGNVTVYLADTTSGFTGLLPPTSPFSVIQSQAYFFIVTPLNTPSITGLATGTSYGLEIGGDNFNSVAVNVPFLPANVIIKSAMQEVSPGLFEYRVFVENQGTPKATAKFPIGMNNQLTWIYVPSGIEATTNELSTTISTSTGGLNLHQTALFMVQTPQNQSSKLYSQLQAGTYNSNQGVIVPGEAIKNLH